MIPDIRRSISHIGPAMYNLPLLNTLLVAFACFCTISTSADDVDCVAHLQINVKKADGTILPIQTVIAQAHIEQAVFLEPGDSIVVDVNPNGYCTWDLHLVIRDLGCDSAWWTDAGEVLHDVVVPYQAYPAFTFLNTGELQVTVQDADYFASACLMVTAGSVGTADVLASSTPPFSPGYSNGLLQLNAHAAGDLQVFDANGRAITMMRIAATDAAIPLPQSGMPPGIYTVLLRTERGALRGKFSVFR